MRKISKKLICLMLCMALILGISSTALASNGNASYGGATATWSMSSRKFSCTLSNRTTAQLKMDVVLYIGTYLTSNIYEYKYSTDTVTGTSCPTSTSLGAADYFLSGNQVKMYVNGSNFITIRPNP